MNAVQQFAGNFTGKKIDSLMQGKEFYEAPKEYFEHESLSRSINKKSPGIILGKLRNEAFIPSLYFLEKLSAMTKNKVFINTKAEWLFLCGRDVFVEHITKKGDIKKIFLVQNEKDENLGYGKMMNLNGQKVIKNLLDRGDFLRRERR